MTSKVSAALYEAEDAEELRALVLSMSPIELHQFVQGYNWDDGCKVMRWVVEREDCDLGTALTVFWLSGPAFKGGELSAAEGALGSEVTNLAAYIWARIEAGGYARQEIAVGLVPMLVPNRLQLELLRRDGVPEVLLSSTPGAPFPKSSSGEA